MQRGKNIKVRIVTSGNAAYWAKIDYGLSIARLLLTSTKVQVTSGNGCQKCFKRVNTRLVKTVAGKPVYRFQTGSRFSERIIGYRIYHMSHRHDPVNADVLCCRECHRPPFSRNSSVIGNFWTSVLATVSSGVYPATPVGGVLPSGKILLPS